MNWERNNINSLGSRLHSQQRVTLKTVANALGLSVTTVSRALKEGPEVNRETIDLVKKAASELGYKPNLGGLNLRTGRTNAIGIVIPFQREGEISILVSSLIEGLSGTMKSFGYRTTLVPQLQDDEPLSIVRDLVEEGSVDGVVLTHTKPQDNRVKYLLEVGKPFVTFGRTELLSPHPWVDIDHEIIGEAAASRFIEAGHVAPILIAPSSQFSYSLQFVKGWTREFNRRNLRVPDERILFIATTPDSGREALLQALLKFPDATSAFVASDEAALGVVAGLAERGRTVGVDFSLITYGGSRLNDFYNPRLSTYHFPNFAIGQKLAGTLHRAIAGEQASQLQTLVQAEFVERASEYLAH